MDMDPYWTYSDATTYYSNSTGSIWSTTDSASFVYTEQPYWAWVGFDGVRGAVTRIDDKRDGPRVRTAAHILRGPFAAQKPKKHQHYRRDSDTHSNYSCSSASTLYSREQSWREASPMPQPPPQGYPGSIYYPQYQYPQYFDNRAYNPQISTGMGMMGVGTGGTQGSMNMGPPLHQPSIAQHAPPQPRFETGFVQLGGGATYQHQHHDPVWGYNMANDGGP